MQFPESWLRAWANPEIDSDELAHRLTMAGLEVEESRPCAPPFEAVVVARIVSTSPHPDADRLQVCQVDDGSGSLRQIVCGAPNAAAGMLVPLARPGAVLPGGLSIKPVKMRGVESMGMLCSARELGLSQDHAGLLELDPDLVPGQDLRVALELDDVIHTLKLTPNRPDCLSMVGLAHELAALTGCKLRRPDVPKVPADIPDRLPVRVLAPDLCGRFAGRVVRGVNARAATPGWMRSRLERAGQRPVSALVDISNYIMLEYGRPTHVFDLDHIRDGLTVRWARAGESLELLNEQQVELGPDVGVIGTDTALESMAGVMGGAASAVTLDTTDVFLEAAFWWPEAIMGLTRRYRLNSEAAHRFERGVDYSTIPDHLEIMTQMILDICGGQAGPLDDQIINLPQRKPVQMRLARCTRVLGVDLEADVVDGIFSRLGLDFTRHDGVFTVTPPPARFDINIEEDLIEEVARIYGFDHIPDHPPVAPASMLVPAETHYGQHEMRAVMAGLDYQEVINYAFVDESWERDYCDNANPIRLLNPIASQLAVMRSSLLGGLLANIVHNARHRQSRVRVFELGRVFARDDSVSDGDLDVAGVAQPVHLAAAAWGPVWPEQWGAAGREPDFFDLKSDLEAVLGSMAAGLVCRPDAHPALHPGRSASLWLEGQALGWLGEVHPRWVQKLELPSAPVVFEIDIALVKKRPFPQLSGLSRQPVVVRDLAIWLDLQVSWQEVLDTLRQKIAADDTLSTVKDIKLFDIWRDKGSDAQRSLALRFWFQGQDATLDDAHVDSCMQRLTQAVVQAHGARLRT